MNDTTRRTWLLPTLLAGASAYMLAQLGGTITVLDPWYFGLAQPAWAPPTIVFPIVWTAILALCALSALYAWRASRTWTTASTIVGLFALNGFLGVTWSLLFFQFRRPDLALIEMGLFALAQVWLIAMLWRVSRPAALLMLPCAAWLAYAGLLNWAIVNLNGPF